MRLAFESLAACVGDVYASRHYAGKDHYDLLNAPAAVAVRAGTTAKTACRWRDEGLSVDLAEKVCARLGVHPFEVWGDEWIAAVLDGVAFCEVCDESVERGGRYAAHMALHWQPEPEFADRFCGRDPEWTVPQREVRAA